MIEDKFSVPIFNRILDDVDVDAIHAEITPHMSDIKKLAHNPWAENMLSTFDEKNLHNLIDEFDLSHFKSVIYRNLEIIFARIPADKLIIKHCWMNFSQPGNWQYEHDHLGNLLSGIYYYQTTGSDGNVMFTNPNPHVENWFEVPPAVGRMIMFPSYLKHRVLPNRSESERISISFNIDLSENIDLTQI